MLAIAVLEIVGHLDVDVSFENSLIVLLLRSSGNAHHRGCKAGTLVIVINVLSNRPIKLACRKCAVCAAHGGRKPPVGCEHSLRVSQRSVKINPSVLEHVTEVEGVEVEHGDILTYMLTMRNRRPRESAN